MARPLRIELRNEKNVEIGRYFRVKGSTVSEALKGVETKIKESEVLRRQLVID